MCDASQDCFYCIYSNILLFVTVMYDILVEAFF